MKIAKEKRPNGYVNNFVVKRDGKKKEYSCSACENERDFLQHHGLHLLRDGFNTEEIVEKVAELKKQKNKICV